MAVSDHPTLTGNTLGSATGIREENPSVKSSFPHCYSYRLIHFNSEVVKSSRQEWKYTPVIQLLWIFRWSAPQEYKLEQTIKLSGDLRIRCYEANAQLLHLLFEVCSLSTVLLGGKYTESVLDSQSCHWTTFHKEHSNILCPSCWGDRAPQAFVAGHQVQLHFLQEPHVGNVCSRWEKDALQLRSRCRCLELCRCPEIPT